jgi:serine/threonine protein kinase
MRISFWDVKKVKFKNENKKALLFEFSDCLGGKFANVDEKRKCFQLALTQIKMIKTLRHPNIVKYLHSEETDLLQANINHAKCLLITELIKPLVLVSEHFSKEQTLSGLYSLTKALAFLHDKAQISHNNLNESCVYINGKGEWKLGNFELSLAFSRLTHQNLKQIYDLKSKNSITPEEELLIVTDNNNSEIGFDLVLKQSPHSLDAYAWAMLMASLLPSRRDDSRSVEQLEAYLNKGAYL